MPRKPLPHLLADQADRLSLNDLKQLVAYLSEQIQERESIVGPINRLLKRAGDRNIVNVANQTAVVQMASSSMVLTGIGQCATAIGRLSNTGARERWSIGLVKTDCIYVIYATI